MTSHAARMDAIYARQRLIYNFTRKYYLLGRDRLIAQLDVPSGGTVLEIGCGTGRNLIQVARRYPHARLYGVDISEAMLETARSDIARAGLADRITLAQGDATDFDAQALFGTAQFDRVYYSYTLSMIPDWRAALAMALRVTATGGAFHSVDFGQQERLPHFFKHGLHNWLAKFDVTPVADLQDELATLTTTHNAFLNFTPLYRGYAWAARIDGFVNTGQHMSHNHHQTDIKASSRPAIFSAA